jgi:F-type H+-transporting ATPase subunit alpha
MAQIKPDEISAILKEQLSGYKSATELEEVGTVVQVGDGIARLYGLTRVQSGELVEFDQGVRGVVLNLEEDNVGVVLLGSAEGIKEGDTARRTGLIASIKVGEGMLGRVVNTLGQPIDGRGACGSRSARAHYWRQTNGQNGDCHRHHHQPEGIL